MKVRFFMTAAGIAVLMLFSGCGKANRYYNDGMTAFAAGDYENALHYYSQAIRENPNKAEYYIEQGYTYIALEQHENARTAFHSAVVERELELTKKNNKRAWRGIGLAYYHEKNYVEAIPYFRKALDEELLPEHNNDIRKYLANALKCGGDFVGAIAEYDILLKEEPEYSEGYRARGYMKYTLGAYEESLGDYDAAIALESDCFELYFGKYNVLGELERDREQRQVLSVLLTLDNPTKEQAYFIAKALYFSGDYENALVWLTDVAEKGYDDACYYMGEIYRQRYEYQEAVQCYMKYIAGSGSRDAVAYNQAAVCMMQQGKTEDALATVLAGQAISDASYMKQLRYNEVVIIEKTGDYNKAYERATAYVKMYPEDARLQRELDFLSTRVREE